MRKKDLTKELLSRDLRDPFYAATGILPNPDKILRKTGAYQTLRELKNDPHVWSCVQSRKSGALSLEWRIEKGEASEKTFREIKAVFESFDAAGLIRDALEAPLFGFQAFEIYWEKSSPSGKIYPRAAVAKPQELFFFDSRGALRYRSKSDFRGIEPPPFKILLARHEASYLNPYGTALLSKCYWPVRFKNYGIKFWVNFAERYGMPIIFGKYERGASQEEIDRLAAILADMTEDVAIAAPSEVEIEIKEASRSSSVELYKELVRFCNAEISKALLSQTLTTEIEMGSLAAAETHFKIRDEVVRSDAAIAEKLANDLISAITAVNYGGARPVFKLFNPASERKGRR